MKPNGCEIPAERDVPNVYRGRSVALLTQHGKESVIAPVLDVALACRVGLVTGFDTDLLGTFTRDVARAGTQLDAARRKARIGMERSGLPVGCASEGSFGPDPMVGMFPWNVEFLIWIDDGLGIEVVGVAQGKTNFAHVLTASWEETEAFARRAGFPGHRLAVRPEREDDPRIRKGIADWPSLEDSVRWALALAANRRAFIETDMRAFANPMRMENIRLATEDLARKLRSSCPLCGTPGFHLEARVPGLPCEVCGAPTRDYLAEIYLCRKCGHRTRLERTITSASAAHCHYCNP